MHIIQQVGIISSATVYCCKHDYFFQAGAPSATCLHVRSTAFPDLPTVIVDLDKHVFSGVRFEELDVQELCPDSDVKSLDSISFTKYILGVFSEFFKRDVFAPDTGAPLPACSRIEMMVHSEVPLGSAVSSSAALEMATAMWINE